jgi:hypothetical protein
LGNAAAALADACGCKAYLADRPAMAEATYDVLRARGLGAEDIHAGPFYSEAEKAAGLARL